MTHQEFHQKNFDQVFVRVRDGQIRDSDKQAARKAFDTMINDPRWTQLNENERKARQRAMDAIETDSTHLASHVEKHTAIDLILVGLYDKTEIENNQATMSIEKKFTFDLTDGSTKKAYLALIVGPDQKYKLKREFCDPDSKNGRHKQYIISADGIYEKVEYSAHDNGGKKYFQIKDGQMLDLTEAEVMTQFNAPEKGQPTKITMPEQVATARRQGENPANGMSADEIFSAYKRGFITSDEAMNTDF